MNKLYFALSLFLLLGAGVASAATISQEGFTAWAQNIRNGHAIALNTQATGQNFSITTGDGGNYTVQSIEHRLLSAAASAGNNFRATIYAANSSGGPTGSAIGISNIVANTGLPTACTGARTSFAFNNTSLASNTQYIFVITYNGTAGTQQSCYNATGTYSPGNATWKSDGASPWFIVTGSAADLDFRLNYTGVDSTSITGVDAYNGTAITTFNATIVFNGTTTNYSTTNGTIIAPILLNSSQTANITITVTQGNYFSIPQTFTNYNQQTLQFNATPYTIVRAYSYNGTQILVFSLNYTGDFYSGSTSTTNGTAFVPIYNGTYEVTIYDASLVGVDYADEEEELTGNLYLQSYNFTLFRQGSVFFNIVNSATGGLVNVSTNISVNGFSGLYTFTTSNGTYFADGTINSGVYFVTISSSGFPLTYALLTVSGDYQNVTFYVDASAQETIFNVRDSFGSPVSNATITFSRFVNGSVVAYSQVITDSSGFITVYLNPTILYSITGTEPSGVYLDYTGSVLPNQDITYVIQFSFASGGGYPDPLNNTYYSISGIYTNTTTSILLSWEVIGGNGDIEYFGMNTSYNGVNYSQNTSGIPGGGIGTINITSVDLNVQDRIVVTHWFKRTGFSEQTFNTPFLFIDYTPYNSSIVGGLFDAPTGPETTPSRALLAMIIVITIVAATYGITRMTDLAGVVAVITIAILSTPAVAMLPLLFGIITVVVGSIIILVRLLRG